MKRTFLLLALAGVLAAPVMAADAPAKTAPGCCLKAAGAQHTVTNLDNGVKITITSTDPKIAAQIKDETAFPKPGCAKDCPMQAKRVTRTVEKIDTGVVITATATDAATVKALQEHATTMWDKACPHRAGMSCTKGKAMTGKCSYAKGGTATQS